MPWSNALETILENSDNISIFFIDPQGTILDFNSAVTKTFGFERSDLMGQYFGQLFTEKDRRDGLPEHELKLVLEEGCADDENYIVRKNSEPLWCSGESIRVRTQDDDTLIVKVVVNIQKQKDMEHHLVGKNEELQQAKQNLIVTNEELVRKISALNRTNQDLDNFVHTISHDLKAPLNNLEVLVDMLQKQPAHQEKTMEMMAKSVQKLKEFVTELTATAKLLPEQQAAPEKVSLKEVMEDIRFNLKHQIETSRAVVEEDFSEVDFVQLPKKNIRSILQNLVSNAIKYHDPERRPHIRVATKLHGATYVQLIVADNGMGIREEDQEKIFSMYTRLQQSEKTVEGTGVGLAIVKRMAENYGGKIEVESQPGKGTTFYVYLQRNLKG